MFCPSTLTVPHNGNINPAMILSNVVFPLPDDPKRNKRSFSARKNCLISSAGLEEPGHVKEMSEI
jgi:hypothetical protein